MLKRITILAAMAAFTPLALGQGSSDQSAQTLEVGDKAPPIEVETFLKGDPVEEFKEDNVYVVEFWATWCGPCIQAMPHMSKLQREYEDDGARFIGVNIWETQNYSDETLQKVKKFVKKQGDKMDYTVAYDGAEKKMATNYMKAAGENGIPRAFVVNQEGRIAANLHPMHLDDVLPRVLENDWDPVEDSKKLSQLQQKLGEIYGVLQAGGDAEKALRKFNDLAKDFPRTAEQYNQIKAQLLMRTGDYEKAYDILGEKLDKAIEEEDVQTLNSIAWGIVDPQADVEERNLELAMRAAKQATKLTNNENHSILDTLARVHYLKGDYDKAIRIQKKAIENAGDMNKEALMRTLKEYEDAASSS